MAWQLSDDVEDRDAQKLEPIWSELDLIGNGDFFDPGDVAMERKDDENEESWTYMSDVHQEVEKGVATGITFLPDSGREAVSSHIEGYGPGENGLEQAQGYSQEETDVPELTSPSKDGSSMEAQKQLDLEVRERGTIDSVAQVTELESQSLGVTDQIYHSFCGTKETKECNSSEQRILEDKSVPESGQNTDDQGSSGLPFDETTSAAISPPQYEVQHAELTGLLSNGSLSSDGLAKFGMTLTEDSSSEEESGSAEEDEGDDDVYDSDSSSSGHEQQVKNKERGRRSNDENKEDLEPPRTKNEVMVLPPVEEVLEVLEPHHLCVSVGVIASMVNQYIVVAGKEDSRVLSDGSILWLTESRIALGRVDEVFGPVKKPFYAVRFNHEADIPESANVGADVSYVSEHAQFVLKDNPIFYKKAIDASNLDDEELSDGEIEFSDDEKELAAKQKEKMKRSHASKEGEVGFDSSKTKFGEAKGRWQRKDRGGGRTGHGQGRPNTADGIDCAMAGMEIEGPGFSQGRAGRRDGARSRQGSGRSRFQRSPHHFKSGPADGQDVGPSHSRQPDGPRRDDRIGAHVRNSPRGGPSLSHAYDRMIRDDREDGLRLSIPPELVDMRQHYMSGSQRPPLFPPTDRPMQMIGAEHIQQAASGYPAFGFSPMAVPQLASDGRGNLFHVNGPVNVPMEPINMGHIGLNSFPVIMAGRPGVGPNAASQFDTLRHGSFTARQGPFDTVRPVDLNHGGPPNGMMSPFVGYSNRMAVPDFRFQAMPSNEPVMGPVNGLQAPGYPHASPNARRQRYRGNR